ncbi:MAG: hypothetical protein JXB42_11230 [Deltaproteobacteria bacterium]|nr:hypothetical protein [Deltaproteobacteria bacterium]
MNRGYVRLWRKSLDAGWIKNHKLWAFWTWALLKASHKEHDAIVGLQVTHLFPGQFIFGLHVAAKETGLSVRQIRTITAFLTKTGNLTIKTTNKFSIITIVNWPTYQSDSPENDKLNDKPLTSKRQHTKRERMEKITSEEILSLISELKNRYPDQEIIDQAFHAISSTRKSNRISDSVKLNILCQWDKYPVDQVLYGLKAYLEKEYGQQGKGEKYLLGIIRNHKLDNQADLSVTAMKSTGSALLDKHYRSQGVRII